MTKTNETLDRILAVANETGFMGKWEDLSRVLNERGIKTPLRREWTPTNVRIFVGRHTKSKGEKEKAVSSSQEAPPASSPTAHLTELPPDLHGLIERLGVGFFEELERMIAWWKTEQEAPAESFAEERPKFKRGKETSTRTVRLGNDLIRDAEKYAKQHEAETGGSFSSFVELLIWERLGRKSKYLESRKATKGGTAESEGESAE